MAIIALDFRIRTRAFMNVSTVTKWANRLALPCMVVVAAALRLYDAGRLSLRLDEGQSLHFALLPLKPYDATYQHTASLFQAAAADVHPPGYLLLLHEWIARFGTDTVVLRLPSELAAIATIPLLYLLARRLYSHHIGLLASALGAASPFWIWHAQEARMYSFLVLFGTAATLGLVYAVEDRRIWGWVLFTLATGLGIYFHYFAFAVLAAHLVYVVIRASRLGLAVLKPAALALAFLSVAYLPWIWMLGHFYRGAGDPNLAPPDAYTPLLLLSDFLLGYLNVAATSQVMAAWPLLVFLALAAGSFGAHPSWRGLLLWTLFLVPTIGVFALSLTWKPMVSARYLIVVTPALFILLAVAVERIVRGPIHLAAIALIATLMLLGLGVERTSPYNPAAEDFSQVADYIHAHSAAGDVVGIDAGFNRYTYEYYSNDNLPTYLIPAPTATPQTKLDEAAIDGYVRSLAAGYKRLWMVYYLEDEGSASVRHYLDYHFPGRNVVIGGLYGRNQPGDPGSFVNVQLVLYQIPDLPQQPVQARPLTLAQLDWLTGLSSTTRYPDAAVLGSQGEIVRPIGWSTPEPEPLPRWGFGALSPPAPDDIITVFNPNRSAVKIQIQAHWRLGDIVTQIAVPALSALEYSLDHWDSRAAGLALTVVSSLPVTVNRTELSGKQVIKRYGWDARVPSGQAYDGQVWVGGSQPPRPAQLVQLPCGGAEIWASHMQRGSGSFTVSRYLASGQQLAGRGGWSYDIRKGGIQRIASIPARQLGYGNYELRVVRAGGGQPTSERIAYFGIGCTPPWLIPRLFPKHGGGD